MLLAGGAESMSNAPFYSTAMRWGARSGPGVLLHDALARGRVTAGGRNFPVPGGMIETAENLRREYRIPRQEQDELAVRSHQRAAAAQAEGRFADEIVPVTVPGRKGDTVVDRDEHIRPDTSLEVLARLRPIMGRDDPDATVTAGNASGQNDGAAACIVTTPEKAAELGLRPLVRLVSWAVAGVPAGHDGHRPRPRHRQSARRRGAHPRRHRPHRAQRGLRRPDPRRDPRVEAHASTTSTGSTSTAPASRWATPSAPPAPGSSPPSPARCTAGDARYGLETMCIGGGQGLAAVFERVY